uniref:Uncharacterized protein n=1 Tax=Anopheles stephensi TaxID=30069 RepID=A0A182YM29_ANOST
MDSSTKPVKKNPRKGAFCLSQLFFGWLLPLFYRGSRRGLGKDDLTKCLRADRSEDLGEELEEQWEKEVSQARIASREPKLRNALFRTFYKQSLFDGFLIFLFVLIKTILPVVLAQLLIQFQEPTNSTHVAVANVENDMLTTIPPLAMPLMMLPETTQSHLENLVFDETAMINKRRRKRRIRIDDDKPAPGNSIGGNKPAVGQEDDTLVTTLFPDMSEALGEDDPAAATTNSTLIDDLADFLHHAWNDAFWLSGLLVLLTLFGCFCCHHSDLRERLFFNILQLTAAIFYPLAVSLGAEALVSIDRIQEFLALEEHDSNPPSPNGGLQRHLNDLHLTEDSSKPALELQNVDFGKLLKSPGSERNASDENVLSADIPEDEIPFIDGVTLDGYKLLKGSTVSLRGVTPSSCASSVADNLGRQVAEDQAEGSISWRIWATYFLSGGNILMLLFTFFMLLFSQAIVSGSDYFVTYWTRQEELRLVNESAVHTSTVDFLYTYGGIIVCVVMFTIFRGYLFFNICMKASRNLHDRMFARILTAPMRFFDTNPSGRILNRFSKDMGAIDELLPKAMIEAIQILLVMTGILTMITIVNPLLLIPLLGAVVLYALALKLYLRPIQDLKRLEGITRSPVFSHISATLSGLSTIRASGVQEKIREEFDDLQNVHSAVWQLTMASNAALGLWLDCISTAFVACVTFSFIVLHQGTI